MRRIAAATVGVTTGLLLLVSGPVQAVQPAVHDRVVNADPANTTPHVLDGEVRAIAEVGSTGVAGGTFTTVRSASSTTQIPRGNLVAFNLDSGNIVSSFAPSVNGTVYSAIPSGDGQTVYVAGSFSNVNGAPGTSRIARIDVSTGAVDRTFVSPGFNGIIKHLVLRGGRLYVSGTFTTAGTQTRTALATLNPGTGALTGAVNLTFAGPRNGGVLQIIKFDVNPAGTRMVVIGNFTTVNGQPRDQIAVIGLTSTSAGLASWSTTRYSASCSVAFDTVMRDVDIDATGKYFVVVTTGGYNGGARTGVLCDTASRWEIGASGSGRQPTWVNYTGGDTFWSVAVAGPAVYVGGHFRWLNNAYGNGAAGPGAIARSGIAALDPLNGLPLAWNPGRTRGEGVFDLVATTRGLWVGSDTDRIGNNEYHARIALMPLAGGTPRAAVRVGVLPGNVYSLGVGMTDLVGGRAFTGSTTTRAWKVPTTLAWHSIRGAFAVNGIVYYGTTNGGLTARTFDGTTFGGARAVNLLGITDYAADLAQTTGMFYDPATGRLYYSLAGSTRLYYRYFSPDTEIVGAVRFDGVTSMHNLNWASVASMFLANKYLFVASTDGTLRRFSWSSTGGSPIAGTDVAVGGPTVDKRNWAARGAVVL